MKVAFVGVGHWHTPLYLEPLLALPGMTVVGVSDEDPEKASRYAARLGAVAAADVETLWETTRPDFVFVLGRHCDMAASCEFLIDAGTPFAVEKPAGLNFSEVSRIAEKARAKGAFAAVPLVFRDSGFMSLIREHAPGERVLYAGFKFIAGPSARYRQADCLWMFDRSKAGGGVMTNLGVHFLDLCQILVGEDVELERVTVSNIAAEGDCEDYAAVTLRKGGQTCFVETGYLYPAPIGVFDMHFSVRTENAYFATREAGLVEVSDMSGNRRIVPGSTTNMPIYPEFVADVLRRVREGKPPGADLSDMARVMKLLDAVYAADPAQMLRLRRGESTVTTMVT
jgi:predicted dehydrogenase